MNTQSASNKLKKAAASALDATRFRRCVNGYGQVWEANIRELTDKELEDVALACAAASTFGVIEHDVNAKVEHVHAAVVWEIQQRLNDAVGFELP